MNFRRSDRPGDRAGSERLLDAARAGTPPAGDADPLVHLLAAAAAPARPGELAGEQQALAAFRAARASGAVAPVAPPRRRRGITTGVVAWVGGIAATATAGAAFAAVTLDRPAEEQPPRPPAPAPTTPDDRTRGSSPSTGAGTSGSPSGTPGAAPSGGATSGAPGNPGGPGRPATDAKLAGLCRAYLAKPAGQRDKALTTPAYADLVAAAGGAERVEAYCRGLLPERAPAGSPAPKSSRAVRAPAAPTAAVPTPDARPSGRS